MAENSKELVLAAIACELDDWEGRVQRDPHLAPQLETVRNIDRKVRQDLPLELGEKEWLDMMVRDFESLEEY